jgi:hypothetical protein
VLDADQRRELLDAIESFHGHRGHGRRPFHWGRDH